MKYIAKGAEPHLIKQERLKDRTLSYGNVPTEALAELRAVLVSEQGNLCAYTMWRISSPNKGHIEHIQPQWQSRENPEASSSDTDYKNMVYCYPGQDDQNCGFGARKKDGAIVSRDTFVSPLDPTCENRFRFEKAGDVKPERCDDSLALATIELLGLNAYRLRRAREAVILGLPIFRPGVRLSSREAQKQARRALERDRNGAFPEFAIAIHQVLSRYSKQRAAKEAGFNKPPQR